MRYAQIVLGLKGHGKSTYCEHMTKYAKSNGREMNIVNMDPYTSSLAYKNPIADVRDVVRLEDVKAADRRVPGTGFEQVIKSGSIKNKSPLTSIIQKFSLESEFMFQKNASRYVVDYPRWLFGKLGESDGDYVLFDCPGHEEFKFYVNPLKIFIAALTVKNFHACAIFVRNSLTNRDGYSMIQSSLPPVTSISQLQIPRLCVMMKIDLLTDEERAKLVTLNETGIMQMLKDEDAKTAITLKTMSLKPGQNNVRSVAKKYRKLSLNCHEAASIIRGQRYKYYLMDIYDAFSMEEFLYILDKLVGIKKQKYILREALTVPES